MRLCLAGTFPSEKIVRENRPEYVLESFFYIKPWQVEEMPKWKMFLLDSGAFTFMHGVEASSKPVDWDGYLSRYIDFINRHNVQHFFELDVDIIVGYDAVKRMRTRLEAETGKQSIPVWHRSRGLDEFKRLCRDYPYIGIGGFAIKHIQPSEYGYIKRLVQYANACGVRVHGLGYTKRMQLTLDFIAWTAPHGLHRSILAACPTSTAQKWLWSGPEGHDRRRLSDSPRVCTERMDQIPEVP